LNAFCVLSEDMTGRICEEVWMRVLVKLFELWFPCSTLAEGRSEVRCKLPFRKWRDEPEKGVSCDHY